MRIACQCSLLVLASLLLVAGCQPIEKSELKGTSKEAAASKEAKQDAAKDGAPKQEATTVVPAADAAPGSSTPATTDAPTTDAPITDAPITDTAAEKVSAADATKAPEASNEADSQPGEVQVQLVKMGPVAAMAGADEPVVPVVFAENAFPPILSDTEWHRDGWLDTDCLRCHETGVEEAPQVKHEGMPAVLLSVKCRSCHVLVPGESADAVVIKQAVSSIFNEDAFPPMLPNSRAHIDSWTTTDCLLCHEDGTKGAPVVKHESQHLPRMLLKVKCRTCHIQVRAIDDPPPPPAF